MTDLKAYILPLVRWWWLLVAATLIAAIASFLAVSQQPPIYQANATLMIGTVIQDPNPNSGELYLVQQLAAAYADIGNREPVQNKTMQVLGLTVLPDTLVRALPNSSLIEISVTDTDPKRAQAVANELANQLILSSPTGDQVGDQNRQKFVNDQLDRLQAQINETQDGIGKLQQQLGDLTSANQIADVQGQIAAQQQKLTTLQANFASLLATTKQGATNTLSLIEPAGLPVTPIGPRKLMTVGLASAIGLVLAGLAAYGMEALDDTLKTTDDVTRIIKVPILGYIGEIPKENNSLTYVMEEPRSPISDAFRLLRTKLEFNGGKKPFGAILVSSSEIGDGKSTVAYNLAACWAQKNKKVILVDADLRKPTMQNVLDVKNLKGLSGICSGTTTIQDALLSWDKGQFNVIPAGELPPNPVELLSSSVMSQAVDEMKSIADVIIFDCPPIFLADTLVLSEKVEGVLIVVCIGHTRKKSVVKMLDQIQKTGVNLIGIVVNRVAKSESYEAGYYHYYKIKELENEPLKTDTGVKN